RSGRASLGEEGLLAACRLPSAAGRSAAWSGRNASGLPQRAAEEIAHGVGVDARQANQDPGAVAVVISEVVGVRISGEQFIALVEIHAKHQRLAILPQSRVRRRTCLPPRPPARARFFERPRTSWSDDYLPTTTMEKVSGTIAPRPPPRPPAAGGAVGAGGAANSAVISRMLLVLLSRVRVLARTGVVTVCSTTKVVGLFSLITVSVPSPCELKASMVAGLKTAPSVPAPRGRAAMNLPSSALSITMFAGLRQATKRMWFLTSKARPAGVPPLSPSS